jgi:hypothetical protein
MIGIVRFYLHRDDEFFLVDISASSVATALNELIASGYLISDDINNSYVIDHIDQV